MLHLAVACFAFLAPWWHCVLDELAPHVERAPARVPHDPPAKLGPILTLPDDVVVHALEVGQGGFRHCHKRARDADPTLAVVKVSMQIFVAPDGAVTDVKTDVEDPKLATCLANIARHLPLPAPDRAAVANVVFVLR